MYTTAEKARVIRNEEELLMAMKNCDLNRLNELLHEALRFNIANGETITKAMDLETYGSGKMKIDKIVSSEQSINLIGDNAIVSIVVDMTGRYFDYPLDGKYKIIRVWKLEENKWKVIAGSSMKL